MSFKNTIYFPIDLFNSEEDVDVIKCRLEKISHIIPTRLKKRDLTYIINFAIKILYEYFDKDNSIFFTIRDLRKYIKFTMVVTFWISYKFLADEDDLYANELADILKIQKKDFLDKEREVLIFINYNLFKLLKSFDNERLVVREEVYRRNSI
jgi:hypothetical protein